LRAHLTVGLLFRSACATALLIHYTPKATNKIRSFFTDEKARWPEVCRQIASDAAVFKAGTSGSIRGGTTQELAGERIHDIMVS
jgi:flavin-binding protein dodecin